MSIQSEISCPCCSSKIYIDSHGLLRGESFACSNTACGASVAISSASIPAVKTAVEEFQNEVLKLFKKANIESFSSSEIDGYKNGTSLLMASNWFSGEKGSNESHRNGFTQGKQGQQVPLERSLASGIGRFGHGIPGNGT